MLQAYFEQKKDKIKKTAQIYLLKLAKNRLKE